MTRSETRGQDQDQDHGEVRSDHTGAAVVGGGPAGLVLGLLLARAGVDVTVFEKHADFLRDFRGDTIHASTLRLLDELGLAERFAAIPHRVERSVEVEFDDGPVTLADFTRLPGPHKNIAIAPQWDLLDLLADAGRESPHFTLRMSTEVTDVIRADGAADGAVTGVRYTDPDGVPGQLYADLVVGADGRHSRVRDALGSEVREFGVPMDVLWFRIGREPTDPGATRLRFSAKGGMVLINRDTYWQTAFLVAKGDADAALADDAAGVRKRVADLAPFLADRVDTIRAAEISTLAVRLNRVRRWWTDHAISIGDAAHAMSPVAGVGVNLAIQDAVATARSVIPGLRRHAVERRSLARVQRRRWLPTAVTQTMQRVLHRQVIASLVSGEARGPRRAPAPVRLLRRLPWLTAGPAYLVGIGLLPERLTGALRDTRGDAATRAAALTPRP